MVGHFVLGDKFCFGARGLNSQSVSFLGESDALIAAEAAA
jgi:hypothetical protein